MLNINILDKKLFKPVENVLLCVKEKDITSGYDKVFDVEVIRKIKKAFAGQNLKGDTVFNIKFPNEDINNLVVVYIKDFFDNNYHVANKIFKALKSLMEGENEVNLFIPDVDDEKIVDVVDIVKLKSWHFDSYKKEKYKFINNINIFVSNVNESKKLFNYKTNITDSVFDARLLVAEPANIITPASIEHEVSKLKDIGVSIDVLHMEDLKKLDMNGVIGVGKGSDIDPRVIVMKYTPNKNGDNVVLVGKGVTFDSGGLNLKPSSAIYDMKTDMAGAAAVIGTIKAVALNKENQNVIGIIGLVENLPSAHSQKPGDIIKMANGMTVEVADTDAEGRLVLADCLTYAQKNFKIKYMIDLATLTGAVTVALGSRFAGLFGNMEVLKRLLLDSAKKMEEPLWELPMDEYFDNAINSEVADIKNIAKSGTGAGSSTAAHFLKRFIEKGTYWAHIDIAGVAFRKEETNQSQSGASGFGVRLLTDFISNL